MFNFKFFYGEFVVLLNLCLIFMVLTNVIFGDNPVRVNC